MAVCPLCDGKLKVVVKKDTGELHYLKCENQKTEKRGNKFVEVGKCRFKINFHTKLYNLNKEQMKKLLNGEKIKIKDDNLLVLDLYNLQHFTRIEFTEKFVEEDF